MAKVRKSVSKIAYIDEEMEKWLQLNSDVSFSGIARKCLKEYIRTYSWIMVRVEKIEGGSNPLDLSVGEYFMMPRKNYEKLKGGVLIVYNNDDVVKYYLSPYQPE